MATWYESFTKNNNLPEQAGNAHQNYKVHPKGIRDIMALELTLAHKVHSMDTK